MQNLVIVESPTKARTLARFLGDKYQIEASMGHIRDLPKAKLGIEVEKDFEPDYIIPRDKKKRANELKKLAGKAKELWLATDPDREGEAIAWHLKELLRSSNIKTQISKLKNDGIKRVVFHEITEEAIKEAFEKPREINMELVDAQQARRVLDRLVGYKLPPLLWKKIKSGLSAGRVQSVALRLIVEREREIEKFKPVEYWIIEVEVTPSRHPDSSALPQNDNRFFVKLIEQGGKKIEVNTKEQADKIVDQLKDAFYIVADVTTKEVRRHPSPPFITSTLQQTSGNKLGFTAKKTMMLAQNLYEHGLITYMRTDSFNLAPSALNTIRNYITENFDKSYLPPAPKYYKSKSKNAQEAHEAIRPTKIGLRSEEIGGVNRLTRDHSRLYDLIWKRAVASQMNEALLDQTSIDVSAGDYLLRATGSVLKFDGWLVVYGVKQYVEDEETKEDESRGQILPELEKGENLNMLGVLPTQHFSEPPPRFSEASLIKKLEELEIGRPSTYAPILSTIIERFYIERRERRLFPTPLGMAVADFLVKYFPDVFDYEFTAKLESELDEISRGERKWREMIANFYTPFEKTLEKTLESAGKVKLEVEVTDKICPLCGKNLVVRIGRFGKFLACSGFPECKHTEALEEKINAQCSEDQGEIVIRRTKKGRVFYGCKNYPNCKYASWTKPKELPKENQSK